MKRQNLYNKEQNLYNENLSLQNKMTSIDQSLKSIDHPQVNIKDNSPDKSSFFNCYRDVLLCYNDKCYNGK